MSNAQRHTVVIAGGGTAGIPVAAALLRADSRLDVALIEPSDHHDYQPGWTLVGGGDMRAESTRKQTNDVIPSQARWIKDTVSVFDPEANRVHLASGDAVEYDYLVVALEPCQWPSELTHQWPIKLTHP